MNVYEVIYSSPELRTVGEYVSDISSPAFQFINKEEEFLRVTNSTGKTNREAILEKYKNQNRRAKYENLPAKELPIKLGTRLAIPADKIERIGLLTQGVEVVTNDVNTFKAKALADLEANENYNPISKQKLPGNKGSLVEMYPEMTVWIWCRALSSGDEENEGQIFNVTPFVDRVTTNVGKNGGNFQLSLPPLVCEIEDGKWVIKKESIIHLQDEKKNSRQGNSFVAFSDLLVEDKKGNLRKSEFLFHNILQANDLVFIRFETLDMEKEQRIKDNKDFYIPYSSLPGRIYDMIGLIDDNNEVSGDNNVTINITGRDLSKLFIDDGTYFYAMEMSQGQLNFAGGSTQTNELMQRVFTDNALLYFGLYFNNSIETALKFIIQQLSTIKIVPDHVLEYYGDRRNKKYNSERVYLKQSEEIAKKKEALKAQSLGLIKGIRQAGGIAKASRNQEEIEDIRIWNNLIEFFTGIRAAKVRTFNISTTTGWQAFRYKTEQLVQNKYPVIFSTDLHFVSFLSSNLSSSGEQALITLVDQYIDLETSQPSYKDLWKEEVAPGIWSIIKLVIDDGVTERRIVDASASSANGSLINFIRKLCQEPFVEFSMDTYGDQFYLIVRKPPFDKKGIESVLDHTIAVEGQKERVNAGLIDIEIEDVQDENLSYSDNEAYTWYHLTPQCNFIGGASTYSLAYLPAVFFGEYAEIWGSRPYQVSHNYMPRFPLDPKSTDLDLSEQQGFIDLKYLIESNMYLPFTRKGTIRVNGDRRLKRGNFVRYKPSGEIFYIENVQQVYQITDGVVERSTTLNVVRGMRENLIRGVNLVNISNSDKDGKIASYFNIINTQIPEFTDIIREVEDEITEVIQTGTEKVPQYVGENVSTTQLYSVGAGSNEKAKFKGLIATAESSGRMFDKDGKIISNKKSSAKGKYQIINSTWNRCCVLAGRKLDRYSPADNEVAMDLLLKEYEIALRRAGQILTATNYYAVHFIGNATWLKIAYNAPNTPVTQYFSQKVIKANPTIVRGTVGDVLKFCARKMKESLGVKGIDNANGGEVMYIEKPTYETVTKKVKKKQIDRSLVFKDFVVDKGIFNFFLRRLQNDINKDPIYIKGVDLTKTIE